MFCIIMVIQCHITGIQQQSILMLSKYLAFLNLQLLLGSVAVATHSGKVVSFYFCT